MRLTAKILIIHSKRIPERYELGFGCKGKLFRDTTILIILKTEIDSLSDKLDHFLPSDIQLMVEAFIVGLGYNPGWRFLIFLYVYHFIMLSQ